MTREAGYDRAKELFLAACELPPEERADLLERECGRDEALRRRVETLLSLDSAATQHEDIVLGAPSAYLRPLPERIGPYRITGLIGEGGMGTVYEAVQRRPQRRVALKVIRGLLATPHAMRRFEREVELLGRLRHPQMAQIYDAGVHHEERPADDAKSQAASTHSLAPAASSALPNALPYFAMELVNGMPITDFAAKQNLNLEARLRLIIRLCDAVGYAHRKGVIHLDLKPGNILVDYAGHPKILDFGIARATEAAPQDSDEPPRQKVILGTVPYMSPEQIRGDEREIDTRCDIYALGAVCYELITGSTPHGVENTPPREAIDHVLEHDPIPMSEAAEKPVPADLEQIVCKALHRSRDQRYQTTQEFAADLERFLAGLPVSVVPHTAWYISRKFAARHRLVVVAAGAALLALALLTVSLVTVSMRHGRLSRQHAALRDVAEAMLIERINADAVPGEIDWWSPLRTELEKAGVGDDALSALIDVALGRALLDAGQVAQARPLLVSGAERLVTLRGVDDPITKRAASFAADCADRLADPQAAARWRRLATGLPRETDPEH